MDRTPRRGSGTRSRSVRGERSQNRECKRRRGVVSKEERGPLTSQSRTVCRHSAADPLRAEPLAEDVGGVLGRVGHLLEALHLGVDLRKGRSGPGVRVPRAREERPQVGVPLGRDVGPLPFERDAPVELLGVHADVRLAAEDEHLPRHDGERVDVGFRTVLPTQRHLGGHVPARPRLRREVVHAVLGGRALLLCRRRDGGIITCAARDFDTNCQPKVQ
mmetsp:Transcript_13333/g.53490  ORF Transcript_13333/g.53490 Transcript_13333/m.53490 type:complete len:218 (-) Transcript_13333:724-1377(-)